MGRLKLSEEERKRRRLESKAKWRVNHPEYDAKYYQECKKDIAERQAEYRKTPMGRAHSINSSYQQHDKKYNLGECTLTARWIVDSIFPMPCHYCGAIGWEIMGCDRVDNSKPHTPDNVVPCCEECNKKRGSMSYEEFMDMLSIND